MSVHHELMHAAGHEPERWALVLHGVFGSGANWRLFMRRLASLRPDWGFVLVDQRGHGKTGAMPPPHHIDAMVADLRALERRLPAAPLGVIGHSLGGKVALAYAADRPGELEQVWILESQPGAQEERGSPTRAVLHLLESLPETFEARDDFVAAVVAAGHPRALAAWLAMSLRRERDGRFRLGMDLPAIRAILEDCFRRDLWPELARHDARRRLHVVVAGRSYVWRPGDRERLESLDTVSVHVLEGAGHWLHVDAPEELRRLLESEL